MVSKDMYIGSYEVICPIGSGTMNVSRDGAYYLFEAGCPLTDKVLHLYCVNLGVCVSIGVPTPEKGMLTLKKRVSLSQLRPLGGGIEYCALAVDEKQALELASAHTGKMQDEDEDNHDLPAMTVADESDHDEPEIEEEAEISFTEQIFPQGAIDAEDVFADDSDTIPEEEIALQVPQAAPIGWEPVKDGMINGIGSSTGALIRSYKGNTHVAIPLLRNKPFALPSYLRWGVPQDIEGTKYLLYKVENGEICIL